MSLAENKKEVERLLAPYRTSPILNHIAGEGMPSRSGKTFESISPIDQTSIATVARGDSADIDAAAKAASDAFPAWRDLDGAKRRVRAENEPCGLLGVGGPRGSSLVVSG